MSIIKEMYSYKMVFFKQAIANYNAALKLYNHSVKMAIAKAEIHVYE
ncbi:hypothetical protein H6F32_11380 [Anabaena sp. FACHB-1237]|nr:hypothetical protein [Anabaena sp. FACHB-1237]MBD2138176.1 hypothetical protein [Anabaena sp. FACHB-1237]